MVREPSGREVLKSHQTNVMEIPREQSKSKGCLRVCLAGEGFWRAASPVPDPEGKP